jgi:hypothetical protein
MLDPPRRSTDTLGSTNTPPNSWAPGRAVRFFPPHLRATLSALLECAKPVCNLHGWAFVTWRTSRAAMDLILPEETVGRGDAVGEGVAAVFSR